MEILKDDGDEDVDDESGEDVDENPCLQSRVSIHSNLAEKQLPEENSDETDQGIIFGFQLFIFLNIKIMTTWRLINKLCTN